MKPAKALLPFLGTWKMTASESTMPDVPYPTAGITTFSQEEDGLHYSFDGVYSQGRAVKVTLVAHLDGNWYPAVGSQVADTISFSIRENGTIEARLKKNGKEVGSNFGSVSVDGQLFTLRWELIAPNGATITWVTTSERTSAL